MSLPPGFLEELRTRTSLVQVVGRKVTWDARKSNQGKGDMWAPCPFHQEKSPSFHADDRKGLFYCFGCHAKGDAIEFVQKTENASFIEAVGILAREAGLAMPDRDPQAAQKSDRRARLIEVMEQAVRFYRLSLGTHAAAEARAYLAGRGLTPEVCARWQIGFAPAGWQGLRDALRAKGVADDLLGAAGLVRPGRQDKAPYDVFRNRIMFPIRDPQGRAIALGGRAMDPDDNAKYLNSPETEIFHKGRTLFNHDRARDAAGKAGPLIVAEGYMDVIALSEAGLPAAVAPLGTAVTADQLRLMWRIADEPVIALDGDAAGLRAAMSLIDVALPLLEAGKGVRFALMPEGRDPDEVLKAKGVGEMRRLLDGARPMVDLLWLRETDGGTFDSPERRAALDRKLRAAVARIADPHVRRHYGEAIRELRWALFNPRRTKAAWKRSVAPRLATSPTRASLLAREHGQIDEMLREARILAILLCHPDLLTQFEDAIERLEFLESDHAAIAAEILRHMGAPDLRARVAAAMGDGPLEKLFSLRHVTLCPAVRDPGDPVVAARFVADELGRLHAGRGARHEIEEAMRLAGSEANEGLTWRLGQAAEARNRAERAQSDDGTEFEVAPNGHRLERNQLQASRQLFDSLLSQNNRKSP